MILSIIVIVIGVVLGVGINEYLDPECNQYQSNRTCESNYDIFSDDRRPSLYYNNNSDENVGGVLRE